MMTDLLRLKMNAADELDTLEEAINGALKGIWTSLPAIISEDSDGHVAKAQSAVKLAITQLDGTIKMTSFPPFDMSPVKYPSGGGVSHTHPVKKGDEGVIHFMNRGFDNWHNKGGEQDPVDNRTHHLADSTWSPSIRSTPRKLNPPPSKSSQQNRSDNGNHVSDVHPDNGITHASTVKHLVNVGGTGNGSGTAHLPGKIIKNADKVLINSIEHPQLPKPGATFANKKLVATIPVGASIGGQSGSTIASTMSSVMSGGIGSLLSNPISAVSGALQSTISNGMVTLQASLGSAAAPILSALGGGVGLSGALGGLTAGASALAGATPAPVGGYGLADVLAHAQGLTQFFGTAPPPAVALTKVLAPLDPVPLTAMQTQLAALIISMASSATTPGNGINTISVMVSQINALMPAANGSIASLQAAKPAMELSLLAGSAGISLDPNEKSVSASIASPALAALTSAMASIFMASSADSAAISAFPDAGNAGARGAL